VEGWIADGQDVVLVIDVQGARQVKARQFDHTSIFVLPPSFEVLEHRLRGRSKDTEEQMQRRLATARAEASSYVDYDYVVVNDALEPTVTRLQEIIAAERSRTYRMKPLAESIIQSFLQKPINTEARKTHGDSEKTRNTKPRKHGSAEKDGATEKTRNTEARRGAETRRKTETRRGHGDRETRRH
jgi:hypothetical protein